MFCDPVVSNLSIYNVQELASSLKTLNVDLPVLCTDYPGLIDSELIESRRTQFLATFRAYTTGKNHIILLILF